MRQKAWWMNTAYQEEKETSRICQILLNNMINLNYLYYMKKSIITLLFLVSSVLAFSQSVTVDNINGYLAGRWLDIADSNHVLNFTEKGVFYETPVRFTINSKN